MNNPSDQTLQAFVEVVSLIRSAEYPVALQMMAMAVEEALAQQKRFDCAALCVHCAMMEDDNPGVPAPERSRLGTDEWYHYYTDVNASCSAAPILEKNYQYYLE